MRLMAISNNLEIAYSNEFNIVVTYDPCYGLELTSIPLTNPQEYNMKS